MLLQVFVLFEGQQHSEQRGPGQLYSRTDVFERQGYLAVEVIQDFESAPDGAEIILPVG
jgi:hypothetical protein